MFIYAIILVLASGSCLGYGLVAERFWQRAFHSPRRSDSLAELILLGMLSVTVLGVVLHFFLPLNNTLVLIVHLLGFSFLLPATMRLGVGQLFSKVSYKSWFCALGMAIILFYGGQAHDAGLYHLPAIAWNAVEPLNFGLANLNFRFGTHSHWFVFANLLSFPWTGWEGPLGVNGFLVFWAVVYLSQFIFNSEIKFKSTEAIQVLCLIALVFLCARDVNGKYVEIHARGPTPDLPILFFSIIVSVEFLLLTARGTDHPVSRPLFWLGVFSLPTFKLSVLPMLLLVPFALYFVKGSHRKSDLAALLGLGFLPLALWMLRGTFLSGCLAFPLPQSCLPVSWAVASDQVQHFHQMTQEWNRLDGGVPPELRENFRWVSEWAKRYLYVRLFWSFLVILGLGWGAWFVAFLKTSQKFSKTTVETSQRPLWALLLASVTGLAYVFLLAPQLRYAFPFLILAAASPWMLGSALSSNFFKPQSRARVSALLQLLLLLVVLLRAGDLVVRHQPWKSLSSGQVFPPVTGEYRETTGGITYLYPSPDDRCWGERLCSGTMDSRTHQQKWLGRSKFFIL